MRKHSLRWLAALTVTAGLLVPGVVVASPASAQSAPPPTLSGETFTASPGGGGLGCYGAGSFSFTTSGTATGPYPGTFTETGSGTVDPAFNLASFTATFTIDSPTGTVTGTKTLTGQQLRACYQDPSNFTFRAGSTYQATIHTPRGNYIDQGTSSTFVFEAGGTVGQFEETFASSLSQPTLIEPTSMKQCKNGGYKNFPQFQNQGQCVTYVDSHGG